MDQTDAQLIKKLVKRTGIVSLSVGIFCLASGLFLIALLVFNGDPEWKDTTFFGSHLIATILLGSFCALLFFVSYKLIKMAFLSIYPDHHPLVVALNKYPQEIVWAYERVAKTTAFAPGGVPVQGQQSFVDIFLKNGKLLFLSVPKNQVQTLLTIVKKYSPTCLIGYTTENINAYNQLKQS